jgi:RNA polymerase sigma factor (sigma-70 family)
LAENSRSDFLNQTNSAAFTFLAADDHELVIYGVLKRLNVTQQLDYYDDFVQEGRLLFVQSYQQYPEDIDADPQKFLRRTYWFIYWRLMDQLRRRTRQNSHHEFSLDNELLPDEVKEAIVFDAHDQCSIEFQIISDDFFQRLFKQCSKNEQRYLLGVVCKQQSLTEIAADYGVTRQAVYKWQQQVRRKAQLLNV